MSKSSTTKSAEKPTKYRVLNAEISYPTDPAIIARLLAGEHVPMEDRGFVSYAAGSIVDDVPACSVASLIASGDIELYTGDEPSVPGVLDEKTWADLGRPDDVVKE